MIRVLHTADLHIDPSNFDQVLPALDAIHQGALDHEPDLIVLAGDFFLKRGYLDPTALNHAKRFVKDLAVCAPVVIIPGNHDATNSWNRVDSTFAAFSLLHTAHPVHVFTRPGIHKIMDIKGNEVQIGALPTPNKYFYLSQAGESEHTNEEISKLLEDVIRGMIAELKPEIPSVLIYHGTVIGGQADSEQLLSTSQDIAIDRGAVGDAFDAIMCGHLHKPQQVGRFVYSGSPAPLTFGQEGVGPSFVMWELLRGGLSSTYERIPLPVAHQLITISVGPEDFDPSNGGEVISPQGALLKKVGQIGVERIRDARIRVKARIPESRMCEWNEVEIQHFLDNAQSVKIITERIAPIKLRAEDISIEQNIGDLLDRWIKLNPEFQDIQEELRELAYEIENAFLADPLIFSAGSDYQPIRISWKNFKCYRDGEIRFDELGRLVCIAGPNAAGKSNAAETEAFALYKFLRGSSNLKDVIREGERSCKVSVEFSAFSEVWRVTRSVKLSGNEKASGELLLEMWNAVSPEEQDWVNANAGTALETQKKIEELTGPLSLYLSTRYGAQFDIDRLLEMRPAELKDTLQQAVNTGRFDLRLQKAKEKGRELERATEQTKARMEQLQDLVSGKTVFEASLLDINVEKDAQAENLKVAEAQKASATNQLGLIEKRLEEYNRRREQEKKAQEKFKKVSDAIEELSNKISETESIMKDAITIQARTKAIEDLERTESHHAANQIAHDEISKGIDQLEKKLQEVQKYHDFDIDRVKRATEISVEASQDVEATPCKGEGQFSGCKFLVRAIQAKGNLPTLKKSLQTLEKQTLKDLDPQAWTQLHKAISERNGIGYDSKAHQRVRQKLQQLKSENWTLKAQNLARAQGELEGLQREMKLQREALEEAKKDITEYTVDETAYLELDLRASEFRVEEKRLSEKVASILEALKTIASQEGQIKGKLETINEAETELKRLRALAEQGARRNRVLAVYTKAVSRDGLPFLILEQAIPELAQVTNSFLGDSPLSVEIEPLRDLRSGEVRDQVTIWFHDERGRHPLSEASGYQRMALGGSIRAGLAKIQAQTNGAKVHHMFLDEGFGAYDQENLQHGKQMLLKFADEFERVIYITHVQGMQEIADTVLEVTPGADGSKIAIAN